MCLGLFHFFPGFGRGLLMCAATIDAAWFLISDSDRLLTSGCFQPNFTMDSALM